MANSLNCSLRVVVWLCITPVVVQQRKVPCDGVRAPHLPNRHQSTVRVWPAGNSAWSSGPPHHHHHCLPHTSTTTTHQHCTHTQDSQLQKCTLSLVENKPHKLRVTKDPEYNIWPLNCRSHGAIKVLTNNYKKTRHVMQVFESIWLNHSIHKDWFTVFH